jgi:hypothetical protein
MPNMTKKDRILPNGELLSFSLVSSGRPRPSSGTMIPFSALSPSGTGVKEKDDV